jgi:hypothetical protein
MKSIKESGLSVSEKALTLIALCYSPRSIYYTMDLIDDFPANWGISAISETADILLKCVDKSLVLDTLKKLKDRTEKQIDFNDCDKE